MKKQINKPFNHTKMEMYWRKRWMEEGVYLSNMEKARKSFYNLWMFPYPSAEGLHAGHAFASTGSDVIGRFIRMSGYDVFQPMVGYDSFGIHAENYALSINEHPMRMLERVTKNYGNQMLTLGHGYDWTRSVTTSDINYYRWTQWLFLQLFKAGLAYRKKATVNWCPSCKTVLADEQVMAPSQAGKEPKDSKGNIIETIDGLMVCERCGTVVEKKDLEQWFFRITDYADRLLTNLEKIDWTEKIKIAQRNWIGKKEGINIIYPVKNTESEIVVWTSRPDTNFGATFIVASPEYTKKNLNNLIPKDNIEIVNKYIEGSLNKSKDERIAEGRKKTGVFTGLYAVNRLNDYEMPIWVADFVLADVGTGAVVGVPAHDKRDFEFAKEYGLEIKRVVIGPDKDSSQIMSIEQVQEEEGVMVNSEFLDGLSIHEATVKIMKYLEDKGWGERATNYHLRDWLVSRQRYWGTPIPMIYCKRCAKLGRSWFNSGKSDKFNSPNNSNSNPSHSSDSLLRLDQSNWDPSGWYPEEDLPIELPFIQDYKPEGEGYGPLNNHPDYYEVKCPFCGSVAKRETDVMDTFVDSSWYFLRYPSARCVNAETVPFDSGITERWLPVNLYFGGAEHSVLHLMYSRFVTMVLHDLKYLSFEEPFTKFFAHGLMIKDGAKMSKSRGNIVNPDKYVEKYGADTLRLYLMFMGPMDGYPDFRDTGIEGMRRFIDRVWNLFNADASNLEQYSFQDINIKMHQTIKKVSEDIQNFRYNTAIAAIMEYVNELRFYAQNQKLKPINGKSKTDNNDSSGKDKDKTASYSWNEALKILALLLAPFAPHITEEAWVNVLGQKFSIHKAAWPKYDQNLITTESVTVVVQIDGKLRATIDIDSEESIEKHIVLEKAKQEEKIKKWLEGKKIIKEIYIPGKILNILTEI